MIRWFVVANPTSKGTFMNSKTMIAMLLAAALSLFAIRATAQQSEHHQGGMMSQDMMTQHQAEHQKMMTQHVEMGHLIDQLVKGFSVLENEKDPALLKQKLTEHGAMLKELQSKFQQKQL